MQTEETTRTLKSKNGAREFRLEYQVEVGKVDLYCYDIINEAILDLTKDEVLELLDLLQNFSIKYLELPH